MESVITSSDFHQTVLFQNDAAAEPLSRVSSAQDQQLSFESDISASVFPHSPTAFDLPENIFTSPNQTTIEPTVPPRGEGKHRLQRARNFSATFGRLAPLAQQLAGMEPTIVKSQRPRARARRHWFAYVVLYSNVLRARRVLVYRANGNLLSVADRRRRNNY